RPSSDRRCRRHYVASGSGRPRRRAVVAWGRRGQQRCAVPAAVPVSCASAFRRQSVEAESESHGRTVAMRLLTPSTSIPCVIIASVIAMVVSANIREGRRDRRPFATAPALGGFAASSTTREGLARRIAEMESRVAAQPEDVGAAVLLADALIRQTRVTGNAGLTLHAEKVLQTALREDPGNYEALRMQGSLYLSQHRFAEAAAIAEKCRAMRPDDSVNYGVLGDAQLEVGNYEQAFDAFDRMMQLRPGAASYARVAYARELQGNLRGALQ